MSLRESVDRFLGVVGVSDVWAAEAESVRLLASELDAGGGAELWREFRFALRALREVVAGGGSDDIEELFDRLGDSDVRDASFSE